MGFSRQEYWNGLPFPSPGDPLDPGIEPGSPALQADFLTNRYEESPNCTGWGGIFSQLLNSSSSDLTYLFIELLFIYREGQKSTEILKPKDNLNIRSEIWLNKFVERNLSPGLNSVLPWPHIFIFCWAGTQVKAYPIKRELNGLM